MVYGEKGEKIGGKDYGPEQLEGPVGRMDSAGARHSGCTGPYLETEEIDSTDRNKLYARIGEDPRAIRVELGGDEGVIETGSVCGA